MGYTVYLHEPSRQKSAYRSVCSSSSGVKAMYAPGPCDRYCISFSLNETSTTYKSSILAGDKHPFLSRCLCSDPSLINVSSRARLYAPFSLKASHKSKLPAIRAGAVGNSIHVASAQILEGESGTARNRVKRRQLFGLEQNVSNNKFNQNKGTNRKRSDSLQRILRAAMSVRSSPFFRLLNDAANDCISPSGSCSGRVLSAGTLHRRTRPMLSLPD